MHHSSNLHHSSKRLIWGAVFAVLFCAGAAGQTPLACSSNSAVTPTMRAEGLAQTVGDIVLSCSGGTPTAAGNPLPQVNITVTLNTNVTSRILDAVTGASEALLIVDEAGGDPLYEIGAPSTQLACATPLTGCSITSNGAEPYDGTAGHPNVFEGVVSGSNSVTFYGVPLTAPGSFGVGSGFTQRVLRITNIRADAAALLNAVLEDGLSQIFASVSIASSPSISTGNTTLTVGFVQLGLVYQTWSGGAAVSGPVSLSGCVAGSPCGVAVVRFQENFATAFLTRTTVTPQNVPGTIYNSESGFFSSALAASNPNLATAGLADAGTRLKATFQGVPAGAQLWVGLNTLSPSASLSAALTANEAGALSPVAGGAIDAIPAAQLTVTNGSATAVWEVTAENPALIDIFQFPVFVVFPSGSSPSGNLTIQGSFAPNADGGAFPLAGEAMAQTAAFPEPRFTSGPPPSLTIYQTYPENLSQGEFGATLTITVGNIGSATSGAITVTVQDLLPAGVLTVTNLTGSGWSCTLETLTCTRSDALLQGQSFPQIFLTGNVSANAPAQFTDALTVSGGGSATATASDTVNIAVPPQLTSLLPSMALTNSSGFTLVASGANIVSGASIGWIAPGGAQTTLPAVFIGSSQLQATIPANLLTASGVAQVGIINPNLTFSGLLPFTIMPAVSVSVNPASGAGASQTFTFVYTDVNVASDLASAQAIINTSVTGVSACYVWVTPGTGTIWLADNAGNWPSSLTLGSAGTLQNSQCAVNVGSSSGALSGNTYTLNLAITFESGFTGLKNIYGVATNMAGPIPGWQTLGSWTAASSPPIHAVSVSPPSGAGSAQTFTFVYTDSNGATDLASAQAIVNTSITSASACYVWVSPGTGTIWLAADAGTWPASMTLGSAGALQNSQCAVNIGSSSGALSGNTYTLNLAITFQSGFTGPKNIYSQATSMGAQSSGWQTVGTWTAVSAGPVIHPVSVNPASGAGASQTFTFVYTDSSGATDLASAQAIINTSITSVSACYVWVTPGTGTIWLAADAGNWPASLTLGSAGTLQNSQCAVNVGSSSGALSGNTYTLNLAITFQSGFTGAKNIYSQATSMGAQSSGWQMVGTWTAAGAGPAIQAVSVSPSSGAGVSQTFSFVYTDSNGATDLASAQALINSSITSVASCYVWVTPATGTIWLADNAGNWPASMTLGSAGTLQNSQCAVNVGSSSGALSGSTYTLNLAITFQSGFTGAKNIYSLATNLAALSSGWVSVGTWTP